MFTKSQKVINSKMENIAQDIKNSNILDIDDIKQAIRDDIGEYILGTYDVPSGNSDYYDFYELYGKFIDENTYKIYKRFFSE